MDPNNFYWAGIVVIIFITIYLLLQKRKVKQVMQNGNKVMPLMQQRAVQLKVERLRQAVKNNEAASVQLQALALSYRDNHIDIRMYNEQLDIMIDTLCPKL